MRYVASGSLSRLTSASGMLHTRGVQTLGARRIAVENLLALGPRLRTVAPFSSRISTAH